MSACASNCSTERPPKRCAAARTAPAVMLCSPPRTAGRRPWSRIQPTARSTRAAMASGPSAVGSTSGSVWMPAR